MRLDDRYTRIVSLDQLKEGMVLYDANPETLVVEDKYRIIAIEKKGYQFFDYEDSAFFFVKANKIREYVLNRANDNDTMRFYYFDPLKHEEELFTI